jgi:hypothetical protein
LALFLFRVDRLSMVVATIVWGTTIAAFAQTFVPRSTSLVYDAFFVLFLVPATLAIAELLRHPTTKPLRPAPIAATIIVYIGLMLLLSASATLRNNYLAYAMAMTCLFSAAVVIVAILRWRTLMIGMLFLTLQASVGSFSRESWTRIWHIEKERAETVTQILTFVKSYGITRRPIIWIGVDANVDLVLPVFRSFLVRCGFEATLPESSPDLKLRWQDPVARGQLLVVLTSPVITQHAISVALALRSFKLTDVRAKTFGSEPRQLQVTIGRLD